MRFGHSPVAHPRENLTGVHGYVEKPIDRLRLLRAVEEAGAASRV